MRPETSPSSATQAEFDLLLGCARTRLDGDGEENLAKLAGREVDAQRLLKLAGSHGLIPLLHRHCRKTHSDLLSAEAWLEAEEHLRDSTRRNLLLAGELARLVELFRNRGIKVAPYKGAVVAAELYGNLALRSYCDLDLLIDGSDLVRVEDVLRAEGYQPEVSLTKTERETWLKENCELNFNGLDGVCHVEVHWEVLPPRFGVALDVPGMISRCRMTPMSGKPVPTLAPEDMLPVLCAHGFKHFWGRLFWICDVAELIRAHPGLDWEAAIKRAERARCRRMLWLGLALASELLGAPLPARVKESIEADGVVGRLRRQTEEWLREETGVPRTGLAKAKYALRGGERLRDRLPMWRYFRGRAFRPTEKDRAWVRLPAPLGFLYWLLRPLRLLRDYGFGRGGRGA